MKNFNRDSRSGGDRGPKTFGKRDFGGGGRSFGAKPAGRPFMHKATCSKCGNQCEVPFKPTGERPVFCSNCFEHQGKISPQRAGGSDFARPSFDAKPMFQATCSTCGNKCEVPFRPMEGKPVYCKQCFVKPGSSTDSKGIDELKAQFAILNTKLDTILKALSAAPKAKPESVVEKSETKMKEEAKPKAAPKKAGKKEKVGKKK